MVVRESLGVPFLIVKGPCGELCSDFTEVHSD